MNDYENITPIEVALSDSEGTQKLKKGEKSGFHSLLMEDGTPSTGETVEVRMRPLDSLLKERGWNCSVDVIKIGVEGAEMKVIKGTKETLTQNKNVTLFIDIYPNKVNVSHLFSLFRDLGFNLFRDKPPFTTPIGKKQTTPHSVIARRA